MKFLRHIVDSEKGQVLPIVLALLALGGLTIVPALNYAATGLNSSRTIEKGVNGLYAAEAGVEDALWCLGNSISPSQQLSGNINQLQIAIQSEEKGTYTVCFGEVVGAGEHSNYLGVDGEMAWDEGAQAYKYTITVIWQPDSGAPTIHLVEVGARLPLGYSYQSGSAAGFADNLSTSEPDEVLDTFGAYMLTWEFELPYPSVSQGNPVETQNFYITGEGSQEGDYTWAVADRNDIGETGEITGTLWRITATAIHSEDGEITAKIVADVILESGKTNIVSWQISK